MFLPLLRKKMSLFIGLSGLLIEGSAPQIRMECLL
ncbi:hypothetical protein COLO4_08882 [Corchorus olitorius]|uniref:Uncharacterized protein n=1 Tax=Corchorus olitorius TaxID=93759 RepID=A0A1R3KE70_9ROSI|nr:hypothetical protein COLO4_08882 [Corchorus olitorius]